MKAASLAITLVAFTLTCSSLAWAEGVVAQREDNQQTRIENGIHSGQLTEKETAHLEKDQAKIEVERQKALADGKMTKKEKAKLTHQENKESRKIFRKKHNGKHA